MRTKIYWVLILLLIGQNVFARKTVTRSNQQWIQYYNQTRITDRWYIGMDGSFRWKDGEKLQYIGRAGLGFQVNQRLKISAGVAVSGTYQSDKLGRTEFRAYQELLAPLLDKKISITSRFRLEERFFKNRLEDPPTHDFNLRFRYQLVFKISLIDLSKKNDFEKLSPVLSDEIFINAGKDITYNTFDRNRVLIGPSWQVSKSLILGVSYMYQLAHHNSPASYDSDDVLWLTLRHNMDWAKSKSNE